MGKKPVVFLIIFTIIMGFIFLNVGSDDKEFQPMESPRNQLSDEDSIDYGNYIKIESTKYELSLSSPVADTGSMTPSIPNSAKIITRTVTKDEELFIGDIVCFFSKRVSGTQICHRIIEIDGEGESGRIFTRGDNVEGGGEVRRRDEINSIVVGVLY